MHSIAHVVFDLPIDGHFDYLIPMDARGQVGLGLRVKAPFGPKTMTGFVVATASQASVPNVKPLKKIEERVFGPQDLEFARRFCAYYGCSLGEALATIARHRTNLPCPSYAPFKHAGAMLNHCPDGNYKPVLEQLTKDRNDYFIVVPDAFTAENIGLTQGQRARMGLRSAIFEAFSCCGLVIVIDEENPSFKQEQTPMYDVRQTVLMAQNVYGFEIAFVSATPSVELMHLAQTKVVAYRMCSNQPMEKPAVIDLTQYRFLDKGLLSPPVRNALDENFKGGKRSLIVLNRRGNYSVTQCKECGHVLKCPRCDSAMVYSRSQKSFSCRHCTHQLSEAPDCPVCRRPNWRSFGMGVEQLQKELGLLFPTAKIAFFERTEAHKGKPAAVPAADILISTQAILRFKGRLHFQTAALVDFDSEINRTNIHSSFKGWSLANQLRLMSSKILVQTRNPHHHVLTALAASDFSLFYSEELRLRRELDFSPFCHWVSLTGRSKTKKFAEDFMQTVYNEAQKLKPQSVRLLSVEPAMPAKVRDQYRFQISAGGLEVEGLTAFLKQSLRNAKRPRQVLLNLNVDP